MHNTRLPKLRHRLTPYQATQRLKKIQRRKSQAKILEGVRRDPLRKWRSRTST